jgi:hypothetical protein
MPFFCKASGGIAAPSYQIDLGPVLPTFKVGSDAVLVFANFAITLAPKFNLKPFK